MVTKTEVEPLSAGEVAMRKQLANLEALGIAGNTPQGNQAVYPRSILVDDSNATGKPANLARRSTLQTYNDAGFAANIPVANDDGLSIAKCKSVRVKVASPNGVINSGTVRYWIFDGGSWAVTTMTEALIVGANAAITSEASITFSVGRIFAELIGFTNAGGSGSPQVELQVM